MPLLDHFHPPLSLRRHWHAFHNSWATYISSSLNALLPPGYFAEANVQFGIEIDVAAFDETNGAPAHPHGEAMTEGVSWSPPSPTQTVAFSTATDCVEVLVYQQSGGPNLAGAVELVSPANKDRPETREAFVSKCASYLQQGIGLVVVDVVSERSADLHSDLLRRVAAASISSLNSQLYAVGYRPVERSGQTLLDLYEQELVVGRVLPTVPLWLRGGVCIAVDLETTYERTCREQRVWGAADLRTMP